MSCWFFGGETFQLFLKTGTDLRSRQWPLREHGKFFVARRRSIDRKPDGTQHVGVVRAAWKQMPVEMRDLIAEQFIVEFMRLEVHFDGLGDKAHLVEITVALGEGEFTEFADMLAIDDDAVAEVKLPGAQAARRNAGNCQTSSSAGSSCRLFNLWQKGHSSGIVILPSLCFRHPLH